MENSDLLGVSRGALTGHIVGHLTTPYYYSVSSQCPERTNFCQWDEDYTSGKQR